MAFVTFTLAVVAAFLVLPTTSDLLSIASTIFRRRASRSRTAALPRLLFIVPAHNEQTLIAACVRSLLTQRYPSDRLSVVVIADNCTDRTAVCARASGAVCLERSDALFPGKPRAIAWAVAQLPLEAHDAVIIIDADTVVDSEFGAALANAAPLEDRVVQAYFDVANPDDSALTRMAAVLAAANFGCAYPLKRRAGVNAPLLGNGMCIGTAVLAAHGWKAFTIAEDWELYALYTAAGVRIESVHEAKLFAQEARSLSQSATQRQRWTAGKLTVFTRHVGGVIRSRRIGARQKLDAVAELSAPGPVVHLAIAAAASLATVSLNLPGAVWLLGALWIPILRLSTFAAIGLVAQPDPIRAAVAFLFLPAYAVWRLATAVIALKMVGDKPWVRTARH